MTLHNAHLPVMDDSHLPRVRLATTLAGFVARPEAQALVANLRSIQARDAIVDYIIDFKDAMSEALPARDEYVNREAGKAIRSLETVCNTLENLNLQSVFTAAKKIQHGGTRMMKLSSKKYPPYSNRKVFYEWMDGHLKAIFDRMFYLADTFTGFRFIRFDYQHVCLLYLFLIFFFFLLRLDKMMNPLPPHRHRLLLLLLLLLALALLVLHHQHHQQHHSPR